MVMTTTCASPIVLRRIASEQLEGSEMDDFFFPAFEHATVVAAAEAKMVAIQCLLQRIEGILQLI
jgi:hypothetical protein